jgi:hypothetical protein
MLLPYSGQRRFLQVDALADYPPQSFVNVCLTMKPRKEGGPCCKLN